MSKITLTPNASGTGTFTIQSPNSNTDRTFTLPDRAGELSVSITSANDPAADSNPDGGVGTVWTNSTSGKMYVLTDATEDANVWKASGGAAGSQDFVASGVVETGNLVGLNADGTVSVVSNPFPDVEDSAGGDYNAAAYDTVNNKVLVVYKRGNNMYGVVGTISNNTITFGTETTVFTHTHFFYHVELEFDPTAEKFVVLYADSYNAYKMQGHVITISGTTFTVGSKATNLTAQNSSHIRMAYDEDNNRLVAVYRKNGYGAFAALLTISGTSVSLSSETQMGTNANGNYPALCYNPDENSFITYYYESSTLSKIRTFSVSGSTITMGTEYTIHTTDGSNYGIAYDPDNSRFLTARKKLNAGTELITGTVSGSTITLGNPNNDVGDGSSNTHVFYNPLSDGFLVAHQSPTHLVQVAIDSGNKIGKVVINSLTDIDEGLDGQLATVYVPDEEVFFTNAADGKAVLFDPTSTINSVIGVASEDISDGATGPITTAGGFTENLSGLTVPEYHYVQADASIGTKVTDSKLGLATSATNLIVTL